MSWNVQGILEDAVTSSTRAIQFDRDGQYEVAVFYYREAAKFLELAIVGTADGSNKESWTKKAAEYKERAQALDELRLQQQEAAHSVVQSEGHKQLQQCRFLLHQALDADEAGNKDKAVELYARAVELGIRTRSSAHDSELQNQLDSFARQALERAEELKSILPPVEDKPTSHVSVPPKLYTVPEHTSSSAPVWATSTPNKGAVKPELHRGSSAHLKVTGSQESYTEEEKRVLQETSDINQKEYVPFMKVDLRECFKYSIPFTDKDGLLALSPKQKRDFGRWARPDDIYPEPKMVVGQQVDCYSIKQTIVSDSSFVASLAVSALYERRFQRRLITSIIYPQNSKKEPIYNPSGKYMVKLHINGVPRKVIIDDYLPVGRHGELLCSYSTHRGELWISLLEKAYMKVMGGYDFPGSISNVDLHALTGWIPERIAVKPREPDFNVDALFDKLLTCLHKGDILVTVATGQLPEAEADRSGLVPSHAYAVLDVRKIKDVRLLQLKNPWSSVRWRGNYSELDMKHWTPELRQKLNFDPKSAAMFDNGVFWIDYESILRFYDVFYLNWNPGLFSYMYCTHQSWSAGMGPSKDAYNMGENPQFRMEVKPGTTGAVWILLTRHITQIEDFKENQEFITVLVYKNAGRRVYYPNDPAPYIDGVRINSPHYLCKIILNENSAHSYTLVISQYEKTNTIFYTLCAYATCPFTLVEIGSPYRHTQKISDGQWKGVTAGGCANHPTFGNNPCYQMQLKSPHNNNQILLDLRGPKAYQIGVELTCVVTSDPNVSGYFKSKNSGPFRSGFVVLDLEDVPAGTYNIVPSTFLPNQEGPFILTVKASCAFSLAQLQ